MNETYRYINNSIYEIILQAHTPTKENPTHTSVSLVVLPTTSNQQHPYYEHKPWSTRLLIHYIMQHNGKPHLIMEEHYST